jgi:chorismate-pyruvate lyase
VEGPGGAIVDIRGLSLIPRILLATDGAITHILEAYAGETVDFVRVRASVVSDGADRQRLALGDDERALRRISLLRGSRSGRVFVHADSVVVVDRIPEPVATELLATDGSLLKLLAHHRIGTFRETVAEWEGTDAAVAAHFGAGPDEIQVARTYEVVLDGRPVAWITESFPKGGFSAPVRRAAASGNEKRRHA